MTHNAFWALENDEINTWAYADNIFSKEECEKIIEIGKSRLIKSGVVNGDESVRKSDVAWLYAADDLSWAFRKLTDVVNHLNDKFFKFDIFGFGEGLQFTKYEAPNGCYGSHMDTVFKGIVRKLSISVQLSDPETYEGGDLLLHTSYNPICMGKEQGKLIIFPSYTLHEVKPVTQGTRYSLVSWVTGKPFK